VTSSTNICCNSGSLLQLTWVPLAAMRSVIEISTRKGCALRVTEGPGSAGCTEYSVLGTQCGGGAAYSHSIVAGGFEETSYATRLIPGTSLITRDEIAANTS
jgi:hypothetical protein